MTAPLSQDRYCWRPKLRNILQSLPQFSGSHFRISAFPHFCILGTPIRR